MSIKRNTPEFIELAVSRHGAKYDYSKVNYIDAKAKIEIICPRHGVFFQSPDAHLRGEGCGRCGYEDMNQRKVLLAKKEFIGKAKLVHGEKYNYSHVNYTGSRNRVEIVCRDHGSFFMKPNNFLNGQGCPVCGRLRQHSLRRFDTDIFISRAIGVYGHRYDYSLVQYKTARRKITIICREHGPFLQTPYNHLEGKEGCPECFSRKLSMSIALSRDEFIKKAKTIHGDKYDYSMVEYRGMRFRVPIICPRHGVFMQSASLHTHGGNCPKCKSSKGEAFIMGVLNEMGVGFIQEKTFPTCKGVKVKRFDFFIPEINALIEYHGKQHYAPVERFGGFLTLMELRANDEYKKIWALQNGFIFKEYNYSDPRDYIARSIRGIYAYHKKNTAQTIDNGL